MKILHICMTQYTDGMSYQENMLAKYHKKDGHDVTVLTSMYCYKHDRLVEDKQTTFFDENHVKIIRLKKRGSRHFNKIPTYVNFQEEVFNIKPDIIFSHGCQYRDIKKIIKYMKKNPDCKLYVDNHADFSNSATNIMSKYVLHRVIWKYYAKIINPYVTKFYGVLPSRVDFLISEYKIPKDKIELLVMGLDDDLANKVKSKLNIEYEKNKIGICKNDFVIITGGKIDVSKKQVLTLMKVINELDLNVKLLIFGSVIDELKSEFSSLLSNKIIYLGWLNHEQTITNLLISDLAVFPGRHSVMWEQVCGLGIPMIVKRWDGTTHVDCGGNVEFLSSDSKREIEDIFKKIIDPTSNKYNEMKCLAMKYQNTFMYSEIAKKSIKN